ncbi:MAG: hypothetical protein LBV80_11085 [Deltaproteobacteria bacterium]|jgi:hypothetical protein|nr:hypothetical protein [Deltaproteobacteria bacterium]
MRNLAWWIIYLIAAIWLQKLIPGFDAMIPGLILCLQERQRQQTLLVLMLSIFLQEGVGTLPFGASIMWYGFVFASFYVGGWFFMAENRMFIIILSMSLAVGRVLLLIGIGELQTLPLDTQALLGQCVAQAALTPLFWLFAGYTRRRLSGKAG